MRTSAEEEISVRQQHKNTLGTALPGIKPRKDRRAQKDVSVIIDGCDFSGRLHCYWGDPDTGEWILKIMQLQ
jgi:hypothetical protein